MAKQEMTPKQAKQYAIGEAIRFLTNEQKKKVVGFILLLPVQYNELITDSIKVLNGTQLDQVLEFIALMPGEGKGEIHPRNGGTETDS